MINYYKEKLKIRLDYIRAGLAVLKSKKSHGLNPTKKYAFIFFAADYNNLGDLAITISQQKFLQDTIGTQYTIIEIYESETFDWISEIKTLPIQNVLITLIGGGNSGSLYDFIEKPRRYLLRTFRNYKIISFPQTICFDDSEQSMAIKEEFTRLANRCDDLTLIAREKRSEQVYLSITNAHVLLTPDIVFSYKKYITKNDNRDPDSVALILRDDKEKLMTSTFQDGLIKLCKKRFDTVKYMDTCDIEYHDDNTQELLNDYLKKLQSVSLVITDRLHGMILSYITDTPCIVFSNNNWKIKSTYETWLRGQDIVHVFNPENSYLGELESMINTTLNQEKHSIVDLNDRFAAIRSVLEEKHNARNSH